MHDLLTVETSMAPVSFDCHRAPRDQRTCTGIPAPAPSAYAAMAAGSYCTNSVNAVVELIDVLLAVTVML
jgi:hypothetical protein